MNCREYANVAFWDLDDVTKKFNCTRFFSIPSPMKRMVVDADGS